MRRPRNISATESFAIVEMRRSGISVKDVAKSIGCCMYTVCTHTRGADRISTVSRQNRKAEEILQRLYAAK